jgi:hypothetical protein
MAALIMVMRPCRPGHEKEEKSLIDHGPAALCALEWFGNLVMCKTPVDVLSRT